LRTVSIHMITFKKPRISRMRLFGKFHLIFGAKTEYIYSRARKVEIDDDSGLALPDTTGLLGPTISCSKL
jgi:hypothetical protein